MLDRSNPPLALPALKAQAEHRDVAGWSAFMPGAILGRKLVCNTTFVPELSVSWHTNSGCARVNTVLGGVFQPSSGFFRLISGRVGLTMERV